MQKQNTLICTVGTSLFESNLKHLSESTANAPTNWHELKQAYDLQNWALVADELLKIQDPSTRVCGAEINTVEEIRKKDGLIWRIWSFLFPIQRQVEIQVEC